MGYSCLLSTTNRLGGVSISRSRDEVYVASVPLKAPKGPAQLFISAAYSFRLLWDLQHFMVIIKPSKSNQTYAFDFQPKDPESIDVALAALSGGTVPGVILMRSLTKLPTSKCWLIGDSKDDNAVDTARKYNENWETDLRIGSHDCRDYTNGLVECLTGKKQVLEQLRRSNV